MYMVPDNKKTTIHRNGSSTRDFMYISDTIDALKIILEKGELYNVGCDHGNDITILELAKKLIKIIKKTDNFDDYLEFIPDRPYNDKRYYISNEKLGWRQKIKSIDHISSSYILSFLGSK